MRNCSTWPATCSRSTRRTRPDEAVALIDEWLGPLGVETERFAVDPAKPNLLVRVPGEADRTLLYNGHLDTVPFDADAWTRDPLGERVDDRLYGRGATDMNGAVAAMLTAVRAFVETLRERFGGRALDIDPEIEAILAESMPEDTIHESEETRSRRGIATFFERIARRLRRGETVPVNDEGTVAVDPPSETELEVEIEREGATLSLEIELEWPEEEGSVDTDARESKATFELYEDAAEEWRWRLRHRNGNIIADSGEGYTTKQTAEQGLRSVRTNAPGAAVDIE